MAVQDEHVRLEESVPSRMSCTTKIKDKLIQKCNEILAVTYTSVYVTLE